MSTIDPEESMRQLIESLDLPTDDPQLNVSSLPDNELNAGFILVEQELLNRKEMLHPRTQEARDLHSLRAAYMIQMKRRGLK